MLDISNTSSWTFFLVEIGFSFFGPQKQRKIMSHSPRTAFFKEEQTIFNRRAAFTAVATVTATMAATTSAP